MYTLSSQKAYHNGRLTVRSNNFMFMRYEIYLLSSPQKSYTLLRVSTFSLVSARRF